MLEQSTPKKMNFSFYRRTAWFLGLKKQQKFIEICKKCPKRDGLICDKTSNVLILHCSEASKIVKTIPIFGDFWSFLKIILMFSWKEIQKIPTTEEGMAFGVLQTRTQINGWIYSVQLLIFYRFRRSCHIRCRC